MLYFLQKKKKLFDFASNARRELGVIRREKILPRISPSHHTPLVGRDIKRGLGTSQHSRLNRL